MGVDARHITTEFGSGAKDPEWLPRVAEAGWAVVTVDKLRKERRVLSESPVTIVFVAETVLHCRNAVGQAAFFFTHYDKLVETVLSAPTGTHFRMRNSGKIEKL
jgi:hypothetical protein